MREWGATSTTNPRNVDVSFQETPARQMNEVPNSKILISRALPQDNQGKECYDRPLALDQEDSKFEEEKLVAKGRVGRRVCITRSSRRAT